MRIRANEFALEETSEEDIDLVAVAHHKRRPFYWKDRVKNQ